MKKLKRLKNIQIESNEAIKIANENKRQAAIDKLAALGLTPDDLNALGA